MKASLVTGTCPQSLEEIDTKLERKNSREAQARIVGGFLGLLRHGGVDPPLDSRRRETPFLVLSTITVITLSRDESMSVSMFCHRILFFACATPAGSIKDCHFNCPEEVRGAEIRMPR